MTAELRDLLDTHFGGGAEGEGGDPPPLPTGLDIFGAEGAGDFFFLHQKNPYLVPLLLINGGPSAKANSRQ